MKTYDDYMTPKSAWEHIARFIPKDRVIWEPFYADGTSGQYLTELGFNVIHEPNVNFFEHNLGDIIVTNPPFSNKLDVLKRMLILDKPFIMILPASMMCALYFRELFDQTNGLQIIIPRRRIEFKNLVPPDPKPKGQRQQRCAFDSLYYCWKMNLPQDINFA
jgi:hypothetical protein